MNPPDTNSAGAALIGWMLATGIAWCWGGLVFNHNSLQNTGLRLLCGQACWYLVLFIGHFGGGLSAPGWLVVGGVFALVGWYGLLKRFRRLRRSVHYPSAWVFVGLTGILFLYSIKSCPHEYCAYDAHLYWDATVSLNQHFGVTPGIGLLHDRLGFGSLWHVGAAFYESTVDWYINWKGLNAWWLWAFGIWTWQTAIRQRLVAPLVAWAGISFFFYPYLSEHQPDLAIAIWSVIFLHHSWLYFSGDNSAQAVPVSFLALLVLPLVKLSALAVVVPTGVAWVLQLLKRGIGTSSWKRVGGWVFVFVLFWGLQGLKNTLQTGYPLYPVSSLQLPVDFGKEHRIQPDTLIYQQLQIRMLAFDPGGTFDPDFLKQPLAEQYLRAWTVAWFSQKLEILVLFAGFCIWLVGLYQHPVLYWPQVTGWIAIGFWLASAPDPRFIHGTALVTVASVAENARRVHRVQVSTTGILLLITGIILGLAWALPAVRS